MLALNPASAIHRNLQAGESLLAVLVGISLGLLVVTAGIRLLGLQWQHQRVQLQTSQLQQDLQAALDLMTLELMQAQQVQEAWLQRPDAPCPDAFCTGDGQLRLAPRQIEWATDRNQNGQRENNECSGFRLQAGKLQHKTSCQPAVWTDLTDTGSLVLTGLDMALDCQTRGQRLVRRLRLTLSAHPAGRPEHLLQLQQTLQLRNDLPVSSQEAACAPKTA